MARQFPHVIVTAASLLLAGCTGATLRPDSAAAPRLPAIDVPAAAETQPVATAAADAADDPAIFARADGRPLAFGEQQLPGIVLGTDKKAGLYVYGLDGKALQFLPEGLLNNVDLRAEGDGFLAVASDRGRMGVAVYRYTGAGRLVPAGFVRSDVGEPYGMCLGRVDGALQAVLIAKDGAVRVYALDTGGADVTGTEIRRFAIGSQSEGCVVDDATGDLYVGEEMRGVWRYSLTDTARPREAIAGVGAPALVADVEGVTIVRDAGTAYLLVSSQGDDAFAVWQLGTGTPAYRGRFRVAAAGEVDAVTGTDGIDGFSGPIGPYPEGLVVVQDDVNTGGPQNFKLVDWRAIRTALGL